MAREKQFETAAEKQAAYRERQRQAAAQSEVEPEAPSIPVILPGRAAPALEDYVALQLSITAAHSSMKQNRLAVPDDEERDRIARSDRYARWRWNGFVAGEIASL